MSSHRLSLVFDNKDKLVDFMVRKWRELSEDAMDRRGYFSAALSGGETPADFYRALAKEKGEIEWERVHIFLVDERFVPETDKDSNYGMIKEALLDRVDIPAGNVHPVPFMGSGPESSARAYEEEIIKFFSLVHGELPEFDLIMLGLGADGHTASLFPGNPVLDENEHLAAAVRLDESRHHRITLTLPVINKARNIIFMVTGEGKAEKLKEVVEGKDPGLPASRVAPEKGEFLFIADADAGTLLSEQTTKRI